MQEIKSLQELVGDVDWGEVDGICPEHGPFRGEYFVYMGVRYGPYCPECEREKTEKIAKEDAEKEARKIAEDKEKEQLAFLARMHEMNIEPAYYESTFDNFKATTPELEHNLARVKALVSGEIKKIVMIGKNGTGKTHLACAAVHALGGKIMTMYEISTTIRASYTSTAKHDELEIVDELARLPLLAIDEIGRTKGSDTEANWLSYIIDKRHVRGLPLILISNKHVRKTCPKGGCPDCLENYIGDDIMSRLCEDGVLLKFSGEDWRKIPRNTKI
jgi:DNA replication protein DnaC